LAAINGAEEVQYSGQHYGHAGRAGGLSRTGTADLVNITNLMRTITPDVTAISSALARTTSTELSYRLPTSMRGSSLLVRRVHSKLPANDLRVGSIAGAAAGSMMSRQHTYAGMDWVNNLSMLGPAPGLAGAQQQKLQGGAANPFKRSSLPAYPSRFHRRSMDLEMGTKCSVDVQKAAAPGIPGIPVAAASTAPSAAAGISKDMMIEKQAGHHLARWRSDWETQKDQNIFQPHHALSSISSGSEASFSEDRHDSLLSAFSVTGQQLDLAMAKGQADNLLDELIAQVRRRDPGWQCSQRTT
jgi:hypothetical protein